MSLFLLNILLMLLGPFVVVVPLAAVAWREFSPASPRVRAARFRMPALRLPTIRLEMSW